jgi:transcriptional regulator with XRE-family HTH domain
LSSDSLLGQLGRNIRAARIRCGLKQVEVQEGSGITYRHYQNIEAGRVNVTVETLCRLAKLFNMPLEELVRDLSY